MAALQDPRTPGGRGFEEAWLPGRCSPTPIPEIGQAGSPENPHRESRGKPNKRVAGTRRLLLTPKRGAGGRDGVRARFSDELLLIEYVVA